MTSLRDIAAAATSSCSPRGESPVSATSAEAQDKCGSYARAIARLVAERTPAEMIAHHLRRIEIEETNPPPDGARASRAELNLRDIGF